MDYGWHGQCRATTGTRQLTGSAPWTAKAQVGLHTNMREVRDERPGSRMTDRSREASPYTGSVSRPTWSFSGSSRKLQGGHSYGRNLSVLPRLLSAQEGHRRITRRYLTAHIQGCNSRCIAPYASSADTTNDFRKGSHS